MRYLILCCILFIGCKDKADEITVRIPVQKAEKSDAEYVSAQIGEELDLGTIIVKPLKLAIVEADYKPRMFGDETLKGQAILLEFEVTNKTEGQVFEPTNTMRAVDSFGNSEEIGLDNFFIDNTAAKEFKPGDKQPMRCLVRAKNPKATSFTAYISIVKNNQGERALWKVSN